MTAQWYARDTQRPVTSQPGFVKQLLRHSANNTS